MLACIELLTASWLKHVVDGFHSFWATVCKTVHPIQSDRCLCVSVLSVTLVYCGQTVGWIKMKLCTEVGLGLRFMLRPNA